MITDATCSYLQKDKVKELIQQNNYKRIVDVGGSLGFWTREIATHIIDLQLPYDGITYIKADISNPLTWIDVRNEIAKNGMFDFSICTQTLEHVGNPEVAVKFLRMVSNKGFISVPNKCTELKRGVCFSEEGLERCKVTNYWRGFLPHKWILTIREGVLWFWPKLNFLEYLDGVDEIQSQNDTDIELSFFWEKDIPIKVITDDYLDHSDPQKACELYRKELGIGI